MPNGLTISNSSCLIALDAIGSIQILQQLYTTITVPIAVANECGESLPQWATIQTVQDQLLAQSLKVQLGEGEAEAIMPAFGACYLSCVSNLPLMPTL